MPLLGEWADFYKALATLYRRMEAQRAFIDQHETRLDAHDEQIAGLSDDMLAVKEALTIMGEISATVTVSPQQAAELQRLVGTIHEHTGVHRGTIFGVFKKQFNIPRYDELPAALFESGMEWLRQWGRAQLPQKKS